VQATEGFVAAILGILVTVLFIAAMIVAVRSIILFPAIAVDAPGVSWGNALSDSKGHFWRVLGIMIVTGIPLMVIYIPLTFLLLTPLLLTPKDVGTPGKALFVVMEAAVGVATIAAFAAVASRLYRAFANSLGPPSGVPGTGAAPA